MLISRAMHQPGCTRVTSLGFPHGDDIRILFRILQTIAAFPGHLPDVWDQDLEWQTCLTLLRRVGFCVFWILPDQKWSGSIQNMTTSGTFTWLLTYNSRCPFFDPTLRRWPAFSRNPEEPNLQPAWQSHDFFRA